MHKWFAHDLWHYTVTSDDDLILMHAFTLATKAKSRRPIAVIALAILTIWAPIMNLIEPLGRDPLEVSFRYAPYRPLVGDPLALILITMLIGGGRFILFISGIIAGVGMLRRHRWSWYLGLVMHASGITIHVAAIVLLAQYNSLQLYVSLIMSGASIYLLTRRDVHSHLTLRSP